MARRSPPRPMGRHRRFRLTAVVGAAAVLVGASLTLGWHWYRLGWRDQHEGYPDRPSGYAEVVARFGEPCNADANAVWMTWKAPDDPSPFTFRFHRRLGGIATEMVSGKGGLSTNLDNDVRGHIGNSHKDAHVRRGIYGYVCRFIRGTTVWSTHAWGIAIDVSSASEHYPGHYHSHVNYRHAGIWQAHGWYWGKNFGDAMHFQFADSY